MIWIIVRKEFLLNLVNFRFIAGFILCFVLSALSAWILTQDYAERITEYSGAVQEHRENLENVKIYSELALRGGLQVDKRPEPLGLLCEGVEKYLNGTVTISHGEVPTVSSSAGQGNPLMSGLASLDLALIVQVIFSLLALLFVYDSISGERERGTLSLLMSNPVPRHQVLLGKYLGILLSLFVPILFSMLAGAVIILLSPDVELGSSDGVRLVLICLVSLLYVSAFCSVGIFVSGRCGRSTTSLMFLLFFWVTFILLIPKASAYIASYMKPASSLDVVNDRVGVLTREFEREVRKINEKHPRSGWSSNEWGDDKVLVGEKKGVMLPYLERTKLREPLRIRYADRMHSVRQDYLRELEEQSALANNLARISPSTNYENLVSALARTDAGSHRGFIERTRSYRRELISYLRSKKAFSSFLFFTRMREEEMLDGEEYQEWYKKSPRRLRSWDWADPLDISDLPRFQFKGLSIAYSMGHAMPDLVILIVLNLLFFMLAHISFLRGGVKG